MDPHTFAIEPTLQIFTNPSHLKRTTCDLCRERKVRCDRAKPYCGRCKRTGQTCTYPSASGEAAYINAQLKSLQSQLRLAESKLRRQDVSFPAEQGEPVTHGALHTPPLTTDSMLGNAVIPSDVEAWHDDHAMDFYPLEDLLDRDIPRDNSEQFEPLDSGELPCLSPGYSDSATWPMKPLRLGPWPAQKNGNPNLRYEVGEIEISPATMEQLFQNYFDIVHRHMPFINTTEFLNGTTHAESHQHQALKYAVAMTGAATHGTTSHLEQQCYVAARFHLEMAETQVENSSFLNLETAQTLILVARYEFLRTGAERAIITMARLMQLVRLLELDTIDRRQPQGASSQHLSKLHESRNTLWLAYSLHCHSSTKSSRCEPIDIETIHTELPCDRIDGENNDDSPRILLSEAATHPQKDALSPLALFVLAMRLAAFTDDHHRMTAANVSGKGAPDYNFCLTHERIEKIIGMILSALSGCSLQSETDKEQRVLALVVTFGARITLYKTAIVNVQKATFLGPVVGESQKMAFSAANAMCDVLLQADVLNSSHILMYRATSIFIMRPLALAAEIQLSVVQSAAQGSGVGIYYMNREIRHSMEVICRTMEAFQEGMHEYDAVIKQCREYLDRTQFGTRFSTEFGEHWRPSRQSMSL